MSQKQQSSVDRIKDSAVVAGGYLLFSAVVWAFFTNPRKHEWVDILMDYCNHRRTQYTGLGSKFRIRRY